MFTTSQLRLLKNTALRTNKFSLWQWVDDTFNRLDDNRIKEVGPNMACAEWLMKNGAQVRWKGCKEFVSHYDSLPNMTRGAAIKQFQIEQAYAGKDASISDIGFFYFKDCDYISDIAFVGCHTIDNKALSKLQIVKDCLTSLKINGCLNVSDEGVLALEHLQALKHLELKNLQLKDKQQTINYLKVKLPNCNIVYNDD